MRIALALEFVVLFVLFPAAFALRPFPIPALPVLWVVTAYCYWVLRRQPQLVYRAFLFQRSRPVYWTM